MLIEHPFLCDVVLDTGVKQCLQLTLHSKWLLIPWGRLGQKRKVDYSLRIALAIVWALNPNLPIRENFWQEAVPVCVHAKQLHLCPTLCSLMDCMPPGSSVHGILQVKILEWVAMSFFRGSSQPRGLNLGLLCLLHWPAGSWPLVPPGKPLRKQLCRPVVPKSGLETNSINII